MRKPKALLAAPLSYNYHVAYAFAGGGFGCIQITRSQAIRNSDDIDSVRVLIEQTNHWKPKSVVILNWILL